MLRRTFDAATLRLPPLAWLRRDRQRAITVIALATAGVWMAAAVAIALFV